MLYPNESITFSVITDLFTIISGGCLHCISIIICQLIGNPSCPMMSSAISIIDSAHAFNCLILMPRCVSMFQFSFLHKKQPVIFPDKLLFTMFVLVATYLRPICAWHRKSTMRMHSALFFWS